MKILVTGFDKFGKDSINPSIEAVKRLPDIIENAIIIKREIITTDILPYYLIYFDNCQDKPEI